MFENNNNYIFNIPSNFVLYHLLACSYCRVFHGVMVKALNCIIEVSEFEQQLHYYIYFQTDTLRKGMNPFTPPVMGEIVLLLFF